MSIFVFYVDLESGQRLLMVDVLDSATDSMAALEIFEKKFRKNYSRLGAIKRVNCGKHDDLTALHMWQ